MVDRVHLNHDNLIVVASGSDVYTATLSEFEADFGSIFPLPPAPFTELFYSPGIKYNHETLNRAVSVGDPSDTVLDAILDGIDLLLRNQAIRLTPTRAQKETTIRSQLDVIAARREGEQGRTPEKQTANNEKASLAGLTDEELDAYDPETSPNWPGSL